MYQCGRTYNKQTQTHTCMTLKKPTFINVFTGLNRRVLSTGNVISLWFSLTQCLSLDLHMKMVFHEKAAHSAHKCFSLRQRSSFALFSFSFQFFWDGSDVQPCVSWRSTAQWLGSHVLWNQRRRKVKVYPPAEMLRVYFSLHHKEHWCVFQGWDLTLLMNCTTLLRIFLSDCGILKKNCQWRKKLLALYGPNVLICTEVMPFFCIQCKCQHRDKGNTLVLLRK